MTAPPKMVDCNFVKVVSQVQLQIEQMASYLVFFSLHSVNEVSSHDLKRMSVLLCRDGGKVVTLDTLKQAWADRDTVDLVAEEKAYQDQLMRRPPSAESSRT